jgi:UDP-glucose:(heptosyl)LPS alpha-1,3-glucosyltransferase
MEIGLVKRSFRLLGGGERQITYLIEGLLAQGHAVHLFCLQPPSMPLAEGLSCHALPVVPGPRACRVLGFALVVRSALRRAELRLVQSFDRTLGQQIYRAGEGVHREWLHRKRSSLSRLARGWSYLRPFDRVLVALERRVFCETPMVITNSVRGVEEIARHYGVPKTRMTTIYNGVDTERFHPGLRRRLRESQRATWGVSADTVVLLFVGSGFHRKGLDCLIRALGELRAGGIANARVVVVGKGRITAYRRLALEAAVADLVRFEGHRPDVTPYYAGADLCVLPTRYDPFANACLEAMACGLPVLTTEANGVAELLQDDVNGCVLRDALSVEALANALQKALPWEKRRAMAEAAYQTACEYPLSRALAQTLRVYESALHRAVPV